MKTARDRRTGERYGLKDGVWQKLEERPWWSWDIIAGSELEIRLRRQQEPGWAASKDRASQNDPRLVEPKSYVD